MYSKINFNKILASTGKAYLVELDNRSKVWVPKSVCKINKGEMEVDKNFYREKIFTEDTTTTESIVGKVFGGYTVKSQGNTSSVFNIQCKCGKEFNNYPLSVFKSNKYGCSACYAESQKGKQATSVPEGVKDYTGEVINGYTILSYEGKQGRSSLWKFSPANLKGNSVGTIGNIQRGRPPKSGETVSKKQPKTQRKVKDFTGQIINGYKVVGYAGKDDHGISLWKVTPKSPKGSAVGSINHIKRGWTKGNYQEPKGILKLLSKLWK